MVNIRLALNKMLREHGGNIGYGIRPKERKKGYNKINLYLALKVCDKHNIEDVLLGDSPNTVNSKINSNKTLYNYFYNNTKVYDVLKDNRLLIYIAIIILIIVNLVYFVLKSRKKEA